VGDEVCDEACDNDACRFDGGDCDSAHLVSIQEEQLVTEVFVVCSVLLALCILGSAVLMRARLRRIEARSTHFEGVGLLRRARRWAHQAPRHERKGLNGHGGGVELGGGNGVGKFAQLQDAGGYGGGRANGAAAALGARVHQIFESSTPKDPRRAKVDDVFSRFSIMDEATAEVDTAEDPRL
jgi:hypothetical protein